jgi:hypothetical protein
VLQQVEVAWVVAVICARDRHPQRLLACQCKPDKNQRNPNLYEIFLGSVRFPSLPQTLYTFQEIPLVSCAYLNVLEIGKDITISEISSRLQLLQQAQSTTVLYNSFFSFSVLFSFTQQQVSPLGSRIPLSRSWCLDSGLHLQE